LIVSVPVTLLGIYEAINVTEDIHLVGYVLAFIMSFVFSLLSVKFMYQYVKVRNLIYFAVYCVIVGVLAITLNYVL
jgi:undecaprenyl-diphosphatase